ncbi:putative Zinc finger, SWIM-type [Helianthus annuus]|nr:putative Zinc finger, SWIM-type [Helianthus annuus]
MKIVFPNAEHRYCLRYIHENMKKQWRGDVFKNLLWRAASVTSLAYFNNAMQDIRDKDLALHDWLCQIPPQTWSRSHFTSRALCDILLNICEEFNRQIIGVTDKHVITCLEYIREYMTRIANVKKVQEKLNGPLTPDVEGVFSDIKEAASQMNVLMVDSLKYQVSGSKSQCVVNVDLKTCSCRKWDLTAMPCKHAVAAIWDMSRNGIGVGIPENWVSKVYWLDTWKEAYKHVIEPITRPDMWTPSECPTTLVPPKHYKWKGQRK